MVRALLHPRCVGLALGVALILGCFPVGAEAKVVSSQASGQQELSPRQMREAQIQRLLGEQRVAEALQSAGLTADAVRSRLDQLSDTEVDELAQNLETIQAGKGTAIVLGLLVLVLIGVLIYMQIEAA